MFDPKPTQAPSNSPSQTAHTDHTISSHRPCNELNTSAKAPINTIESTATTTQGSTASSYQRPSLALPLLELLKRQGADQHLFPVAYGELGRLFVDEIPDNQKIRDEIIAQLPNWQRALYKITYGTFTPKAVDKLYRDSGAAMQGLIGILESKELIKTCMFQNLVPFNAHGVGPLTATYLERGIRITEKGLQLLVEKD